MTPTDVACAVTITVAACFILFMVFVAVRQEIRWALHNRAMKRIVLLREMQDKFLT